MEVYFLVKRYLSSSQRLAMNMRTGRVRMVVIALRQLNRHDVQFAMPHTIGSDNLVGETPDIFNNASKNHHFQAILMIHMHMHARQG